MDGDIASPRGGDGSSDVVWEWGSFSVTAAVLHQALSLGLRVLIFSSLSLLFILTTDPVRFMLSLMQQCRLSPKWAYGILAGYRFLPFFGRSCGFCSMRTACAASNGSAAGGAGFAP